MYVGQFPLFFRLDIMQEKAKNMHVSEPYIICSNTT
jgi:hypothetical protein